jgi:hypothetical protein
LRRLPRALRGSRDWTRAHPYALRHLATHAAAADVIDDLLTDGDYVLHADPDTLLPALDRARGTEARLTATAYRASAGLHRHAAVATRRQLLAIDAARCGARALSERLGAGLLIRPRWATGALISPARRHTLKGHTRAVNAVACTNVDGIPLAITGGDREVLVWNLRTGRQHAALTGHTRSVNAVACTRVDGIPVAIAGGDGEVLVWNLRTGRQHAALAGHTGRVNAMACAQVDDIPLAIAATGGDFLGGEVLVWDLRTGRQRATLRGHGGPVQAVACAERDGVALAITAADDHSGPGGEVRVWDLRTNRQHGIPTDHKWRVTAMACTTVDGVPLAVTAGGPQDPSMGRAHGCVSLYPDRLYRVR